MPSKRPAKPSAKPPAKPPAKPRTDPKLDQLRQFHQDPAGADLTTDQGVKVSSTDDSLRAGDRGPTLLEDFHLREKIMRFDHERIPERVVHARGAGAHGYFQVYENLSRYSRAAFLQDPGVRTPVFVRFSTVAGSRGSADTVRDVRGFTVKFYTSEGNFDLVGNNMPVFFIQDGIKFPDLIHAVKPHPRNEIPQAQSAHDSFWDFISLTPETAHMVMWIMSDRAIPRSFRMMEGFGVHTFRLVDAEGNARLVKFHWKPMLGTHSLVWEEAQQIAGKDPDFHRRDLFEAIEGGTPAEWELGVQIVAEKDAQKYGFDMLDATKLLPEEIVPVERVGKMVLDRNPTNYFSEVEQVAFCVGNVVPGIDFTNDPLLQARLFSYLDTQITRLGGPNFAELPINRPVVPVQNNQHDGFGRHSIPAGEANYLPNSLGDGFPKPTTPDRGGYAHYAERIAGHVIRERSPSFKDHFTQARLFLDSQSAVERAHIIDALSFELGKVKRPEVRQRVVDAILASIDPTLAKKVAAAIGANPPQGIKGAPAQKASPALSMLSADAGPIMTRKVAILAAPGSDVETIRAWQKAMEKVGVVVMVVAPSLGPIDRKGGSLVEATATFLTTPSVVFDGVVIADGDAGVDALIAEPAAGRFLEEAYRHCKTIAAIGAGERLLQAAVPGSEKELKDDPGVVIAERSHPSARFLAALALHRHWQRERQRA